MEPMTQSLEDLARAELKCAQDMILAANTLIPGQFRFVTPEEEYRVEMMWFDFETRQRALMLLVDFMAVKGATQLAAVLWFEKPFPHLRAMVATRETMVGVASFMPSDDLTFLETRALEARDMDADMMELLRKDPREVGAARRQELELAFGDGGEFPAVKIETEAPFA